MIWKCKDYRHCGWEGESPARISYSFYCPMCGLGVSTIDLERREGEEYICESCKHFRIITRDGDVVEDLPHLIRVCLYDKEYWIHDSRDAIKCTKWEEKII
jgi:predicted RNA-binding Zn-ribbon protein involved in translation (DUF1610 family)